MSEEHEPSPPASSDNVTRAEGAPTPPARKRRSGLAIFAVFVAVLAGTVGVRGYLARHGSASAEPTGPWADTEAAVPVSSEDPARGPKNAPITIVGFLDFQCPFCAQVQSTLDEVKSKYGSDVRIVWKNMPLDVHEKAVPAATAAAAVFQLGGNAAFWKFHDAAFKGQAELGPEKYEAWAQAAGVDLAAFRQALAAGPAAKKVKDDMELGKKLGVRGTPTFFVNGFKIEGAPKADKLPLLLDRELRKARELIAAGIARDAIYDERTKENFKPPPPQEEQQPQIQQIDPSTMGGEIIDAGLADVTTMDRYRIPVGTSPALGKKEAPVTMVLFGDYECPYCKQASAMADDLRQKYGDKLRFVWKNLPVTQVHRRAEPAAELALEARAEKGDEGFWDAHHRLYASQPKLADKDLLAIAEDMHLDTEKVKKAIAEKTHSKEIDEDVAIAQGFNCNGIPHFFVNGRRMVGMHRPELYSMLIDDELKIYERDKAKAHGAIWYGWILKDGKMPEKHEPTQMPPFMDAGAPR